MEQLRLEEYKRILAGNPVCLKAAVSCMERHELPEEKQYLCLWAPAMLEFVIWLVGEAKKAGLRRLYFLSRDAYPMFLAAQIVTGAMSQDIECRYLRVSRHSLRVPEYHLLGKKCLEQIFLSGIDVSMYTILKRAMLTEDEMRMVCFEAGYSRDLHRVLNRREIQELKSIFQEKSPSLLKFTEEHSGNALNNTLGYLIQEGLLEEIPWAVVDSGWVGTIQRSIRNLLSIKKPDITVEGYYFGLYETPLEKEGCRYHTYYFAPKGSLIKKVYFSNCLFEIVYSEPAAMVEGYQKAGERYVPVFSGRTNSNSRNLSRYAELLREFVLEYTEHAFADGLCFKPVAQRLFRRVMGEPNEWEAAYYGSFLFSDDICDEAQKKSAAELTQREIDDLGAVSKLMILYGFSKKKIHESAWIEGSIVNLGSNKKRNLHKIRRAKFLTCLRQTVKEAMRKNV